VFFYLSFININLSFILNVQDYAAFSESRNERERLGNSPSEERFSLSLSNLLFSSCVLAN
jgi:hypothetical protein